MIIVEVCNCDNRKIRSNDFKFVLRTHLQEIIPNIGIKWSRINEFLSEQRSKNEEKAKKIGAQGSKTKHLLKFLLDEEAGATLGGKDEQLGKSPFVSTMEAISTHKPP